MKTATHLTPETMYGDEGFLDWIVRLQPFHSDTGRPPMSANQFYWASRLSFECGLRISECLKLIKSDFDLKHRILTIRDLKTAKSSKQFTTIIPNTAIRIKRLLDKFEDGEKIFPISKEIVGEYYKNTLIISGFNPVVDESRVKIIDEWNRLMRSSCYKLYEDTGANFNIIQKKLRNEFKGVTSKSPEIDLQEVLKFEDEKLKSIKSLL